MRRIALPVALHLQPEFGLVPDHITVIGAGAPDTESLECPGRYSDLLKGLNGEVKFEIERLVSLIALELELAWPGLPDQQWPVVEGLVRMVGLDRLTVACEGTDNPPFAVEIVLGDAAQGLDPPSIPFDFTQVFQGGVARPSP